VFDRLPEAEAALSKSEKVLSELSDMPMVLHDDIEGWTIRLCLAIGRYDFCHRCECVIAVPGYWKV